MPRYKLRTLLILLAVLPPVLAGAWWGFGIWQAAQQQPPPANLDLHFEPGMFDSNRPQH